ncbi:MAG: MmgE/PrpD family protein [Chloroflexota bacterium]
MPRTAKSPEEMLASFVAKLSYEALPKVALERSKNAILDTIGVALAGSQEDTGKIPLRVLAELGGKPVASVIAGKCQTSPVFAAMANGTSAHALDYDDVNDSWIGHPSTVLVPAILAVAESGKYSGRDVLTAYNAGLEVGAKLGIVFGQDQYARGWHTTGSIGSVAGAAAVARLLNLSERQTQMAMGIAASASGGLRENFGSMTKPLHAGSAASTAVLAGLLAKRGFTSSDNALMAKSGYGRVLGKDTDYDAVPTFRKLGKPLDIVANGIWVKAYPSGAATHSAISAALNLRGKRSFKVQDIQVIECATNKAIPQILIHHQPRSGLEGKFSIEYCVAVALLDGEVTLDQFTDKRALSKDVQSLVSKVKYTHPKEMEDKFGFHIPGLITVRLKNGKTISSRVASPKGTPENPMTTEELHAKFERCSRAVLTVRERTRVIKLVSKLEEAKSVKGLMKVLSGD